MGIVLINREGLIFAGQRIDSPVPAWQMPQGGIDEGEKPREAALRELWEETGIPAERVEFVAKAPDWVTYDLPPELLGRVWGGKYRGQRQKWFLYRYLGTDEEGGDRHGSCRVFLLALDRGRGDGRGDRALQARGL